VIGVLYLEGNFPASTYERVVDDDLATGNSNRAPASCDATSGCQ